MWFLMIVSAASVLCALIFDYPVIATVSPLMMAIAWGVHEDYKLSFSCGLRDVEDAVAIAESGVAEAKYHELRGLCLEQTADELKKALSLADNRRDALLRENSRLTRTVIDQRNAAADLQGQLEECRTSESTELNRLRAQCSALQNASGYWRNRCVSLEEEAKDIFKAKLPLQVNITPGVHITTEGGYRKE